MITNRDDALWDAAEASCSPTVELDEDAVLLELAKKAVQDHRAAMHRAERSLVRAVDRARRERRRFARATRVMLMAGYVVGAKRFPC